MINNDNYNSITKDSTLLAKQVTGGHGFLRVRGVKALDDNLNSLSSVLKTLTKKETLRKTMIEKLSQSVEAPQIITNENSIIS